jgi:hypothetical protein
MDNGSGGPERHPSIAIRCLGQGILLGSLVAVGVFLPAHMTIVLQIAFGKILADPIVVLDVFRSEIPMPVSIDGVKIRMGRGFALRVMFTGIVRVGGRACEKQCGARQWS